MIELPFKNIDPPINQCRFTQRYANGGADMKRSTEARRSLKGKARQKRRALLPAIPSPLGDKWREKGSLIDIDAPFGSYLVDSLISDFKRDGLHFCTEDPIRFTRLAVELTGQSALDLAREVLIEGPARREDAKQLIQNLNRIRILIKRVCRISADGIAPVVAARLHDVDYDEIKESVLAATFDTEELHNKLSAVDADIASYLGRYSVPKGKGGNYDPLGTWFIFHGAINWNVLITGNRPDRESRSYFVRFLARAWRDLKFPEIDTTNEMRGPLEGWFNERLAKSKWRLSAGS
jgi:hypothetical protein